MGIALVLALRLAWQPAGVAEAAAAVPAGFSITRVADGFVHPTAMAFAPDGRLFVLDGGGTVRIIKNGQRLPTPFIFIAAQAMGERGLIGIAFDPQFSTNGYVYFHYTEPQPVVHNRVVRVTAAGDVAQSGSMVTLLDLEELGATYHNGGGLHFGQDGKLYIGVGDNNVPASAQSLTTTKGKLLRINKDGSIPTDNPFYAQTSGISRAIWAMGLRNPYTFAVQPGTGRIHINDVGQAAFEEINEGVRGANYGWPATEGYTTDPRFRSPLYAYGHGTGATTGCAITGGAFYNPSTTMFPSSYTGKYFFADHCSGWIRVYDPATGNVSNFATGLDFPVDLDVGPDGALYYIERGTRAVFRIAYTGSAGPVITSHPANRTVSVGQTATFSVTATGSAPLSYQWQRNGTNITGATGASYTTPATTLQDNGAQFRVMVTNSISSATSNAATLTVTSNQPPSASILTPASDATYAGGQTVSYSGSGSDPEDGTLGASAFTWWVDFHHDTHTHPAVPERTGATSGSFVIPRVGETSTNVWYRVYLRVRDSGGLTTTVTRDIRPRVRSITISTSPSGLQVLLDGSPHTAPYTTQSVEGVTRTIGVSSPQSQGGASYTFVSWSDGGGMSHDINTPASNTTYTATFQSGGGGSGVTVYGDALASGWQNWSWGSTVDLGVASPVYSGNRAIGLTVSSAWGALNLHRNTPVNTAGLTHLQLAVRASAAGQIYEVALVDSTNQRLNQVDLETYGGLPVAGAWKLYSIPLSALGATGKQISGVLIQDRSGGAQPVLYVDAISFTGSASGAPLTVYGDALATGWQDWSWSATVNTAATSPVYSGSRAIAVTITAGWGALNLHTGTPVNAASYTHLRFAVRGSSSGHALRVALVDSANQKLTNVALEDHGGDPVAGAWKVYSIPLSTLGATGKQISGILIQDRTGSAQPAFSVDAISFGPAGGIVPPSEVEEEFGGQGVSEVRIED